jgi:hypothetical protein
MPVITWVSLLNKNHFLYVPSSTVHASSFGVKVCFFIPRVIVFCLVHFNGSLSRVGDLWHSIGQDILTFSGSSI